MLLFKFCFKMSAHTESKTPQVQHIGSDLQLCTRFTGWRRLSQSPRCLQSSEKVGKNVPYCNPKEGEVGPPWAAAPGTTPVNYSYRGSHTVAL